VNRAARTRAQKKKRNYLKDTGITPFVKKRSEHQKEKEKNLRGHIRNILGVSVPVKITNSGWEDGGGRGL